MNLGIIVITHGQSSVEIVKTAEMIVGKQDKVETLTFIPSENLDNLVDKFDLALDRLADCQNIIAVVDIQGGSPFNVAVQSLGRITDVLCGVNIPLLIELFLSRENEDIENLLTNVINTGKNSIVRYSKIMVKEENEEF